jgi:hypothetical protein
MAQSAFVPSDNYEAAQHRHALISLGFSWDMDLVFETNALRQAELDAGLKNIKKSGNRLNVQQVMHDQ